MMPRRTTIPVRPDRSWTKGTIRSDRRDDIDCYQHMSACVTCALKPGCTPDKLKRFKRKARSTPCRHGWMRDLTPWVCAGRPWSTRSGR